jgi:hypothetical protein
LSLKVPGQIADKFLPHTRDNPVWKPKKKKKKKNLDDEGYTAADNRKIERYKVLLGETLPTINYTEEKDQAQPAIVRKGRTNGRFHKAPKEPKKRSDSPEKLVIFKKGKTMSKKRQKLIEQAALREGKAVVPKVTTTKAERKLAKANAQRERAGLEPITSVVKKTTNANFSSRAKYTYDEDARKAKKGIYEVVGSTHLKKAGRKERRLQRKPVENYDDESRQRKLLYDKANTLKSKVAMNRIASRDMMLEERARGKQLHKAGRERFLEGVPEYAAKEIVAKDINEERRLKMKFIRDKRIIDKEARKALRAAREIQLSMRREKREQYKARRAAQRIEVQCDDVPYCDCDGNSEEKVEFDALSWKNNAPQFRKSNSEKVKQVVVSTSLQAVSKMVELSDCVEALLKQAGFDQNKMRQLDLLHHILGTCYLFYRNYSDPLACYYICYNAAEKFGMVGPVQKGVPALSCALTFKLLQELFSVVGGDTEPPIEAPGIHTQGAESWQSATIGFGISTIESLESFLLTVTDTKMFSVMRNMLLGIVSLKILPFHMVTTIWKVFGKEKPKGALEVTTDILGGLKTLLKISDQLVGGASPSYVLRDILNQDKAFEDAKALIKMQTDGLVKYTEFPETGISARKFVQRMAECEQVLIKKVSKLPQYRRLSHPQAVLLTQVSEVLATVKRIYYSVDRMAPLGIMLIGPPGIGKSSFMHIPAAIVCAAVGLKYDKAYMFHRVMSSQYLEGFCPDYHHLIHYSEMGFEKDSLVKEVSPAGAEMLSLIDSQMVYADMAFDKKGEIPLSPLAVFCDSNHEWLGLNRTHKTLGAVARRFVRLSPYVLPKYATNGTMINSELVTKEGATWRCWSVKMETFGSDANGNVVPLQVINFNSTEEFVAYFTVWTREEIKKRSATRDVTSAESVSSFLSQMGCGIEDKILDYMDLKIEPEAEEIVVQNDEISADGHAIERVVEADVASRPPVGVQVRHTWSETKQCTKVFINLISAWMTLSFCTASTYFTDVDPILFFSSCTMYSLFLVASMKITIVASGAILLALPFLLSSHVRSSYINDSMRQAFDNLSRAKFAFVVRIMGARPGQEFPVMMKTERILKYVGYALLAVTALGGVLYLTRPRDKKKKKKVASQGDMVAQDVKETEKTEVAKFEDLVGAGKCIDRRKGAAITTWNVVENPFAPVCSETADVLYRSVLKNVRMLGVRTNRDTILSSFGLGVSGQWLIMNLHNLQTVGFPATVVVERVGRGLVSGNCIEFVVRHEDAMPVGVDLVAIQVPGTNFSSILKHIYQGVLISSSPAHIDGEDTSLKSRMDTEVSAEDRTLHFPYLYEYEYKQNARGKCGLPLICKLNGGAAICGLHSAGSENMGFACPIDKTTLMNIVGSYTVMMPVLPQCCEIPLPGTVPDRSMWKYVNLPGLEYFGASGYNVHPNQKSKVIPSPMDIGLNKDSVLQAVKEIYGKTVVNQWGAPLMKPRIIEVDGVLEQMPWSRPLRVMSASKPPLDMSIVEKVVIAYSNHIVEGLRAKGIYSLHVLSAMDAINGPGGDDFVRRINPHTSAGFGLKGKKRDHLPLFEDGVTRGYSDELALRLVRRMNAVQHNHSEISVFDMTMKDEARKKSKVDKGLTRPFYAGALDDLIFSRMHLGSFFGSMVQHGDVFGCCIGIDMHTEAGKIAMDRAFSEFYAEWDFVDYDTSMHFVVAWMARSVVYRVHLLMGYSAEAMVSLASCLTSELYPVIHCLGNLFRVAGKTPSGKFGTAEMNCIINGCIQIYCYVKLGGTAEDFWKDVLMTNYGDDSRDSIKERVLSWYNNLTLEKEIGQMGLKITEPNKLAAFKPFVGFDETSLLKRKFVWNEDYKQYFAPMEIDSVCRPLLWFIPSCAISAEEQIADTISSQMREFFFHGNMRQFRAMRQALKESYVRAFPGLEDYFEERVLKGYELVKKYTQVSPDTGVGDIEHPVNELGYGPDHVSKAYSLLRSMISSPEDIRIQIESQLMQLKIELERELAILDEAIAKEGSPFGYAGVQEIRLSQQYLSSEKDRPWMESACTKMSRYEEIEDTLRMIEKVLKRQAMSIQLQGDEIAVSHSGPATGSTTEIETFVDMVGGDTVQGKVGQRTSTRNLSHTHNDINDFFRRPVLIGTQVWSAGTDIDAAFDVANVFLSDPSIRAKLRNVALLRGTWVIDVSCAGNNFMLGSAVVAPIPFEEQQTALLAMLAAVVSAASNHVQLVKFLCSMPGARIIDCNKNNVVRITVPFISPTTAIRLFNNSNSALGTGTFYSDALNMLKLRFSTVNQLGTVSTVSSNAYVTVYAHMEDVELGPTTASVTAITTQSDEIKDERIQGPVERVTSAMAHFSEWFMDVPVIGTYAKASRMMFSAMSSVAAIFGWSVPTMNTAPIRVKNHPFQNAANLVGYDTGFRITMDPRQELIISPHVVGSNEDDMCIRKLASTESLLWSTTINPGGSAMSTPLFSVIVHPRAKVGNTSGATTCIQPTWVDFAATPFEFWRGTMRYRLQLVKSPFHKMKIGIAYEPNIAQATLITGAVALNKQFIKIVDIQECEDVTFDVEWAFPRHWAENTTDTNALLMVGNIGSGTGNMFEAVNGYFSVFALTTLQSPNTTGMYINVWVSCPDLQVTVPSEKYLPLKRILFQSDEIKCVDEPECCVLNPTGSDNAQCCDMTFGEQVISFRALLHRFDQTTWMTEAADGTTHKALYLTDNIMPVAQVYGATSTDTSLLAYLRMAYLGWRGGLRKRLRFAGITSGSQDNMTVVLRQPADTQATVDSGVSAGQMASMRWRGGVSFVPTTNGGIEFELPYYSNNLFGWCQSVDPYGASNASATFSTKRATRSYDVFLDAPAATPVWDVIVETAIAEDFTLLRMCAPAPYGT